ncbi:excisionase family DNA-binding protein [Pedobacter sp. L105]|uniref:excisionase family DNA-binding protein n=1 Tax=Pedobacter sp. L105 TaxID=1641871 RepID=UPI00352BC39F
MKELAVYLECSKSTVHRYKDNKAIPYYQVGRKVSFKKSEVDKARSSLKKRR